jgi:hypothetical protein
MNALRKPASPSRPQALGPRRLDLTQALMSVHAAFSIMPLDFVLLSRSVLATVPSPDQPTNIPSFFSHNSGPAPRNKRTPFRNQRFFSSRNLRKPRSSWHLRPPVRMRSSEISPSPCSAGLWRCRLRRPRAVYAARTLRAACACAHNHLPRV